MKTITLKITGMHCTSCAINVDFELEDLAGVVEAKTNYAKQISVVTYDPKKVHQKQIIAAIRTMEYEVVVAK